MTGTPRRARRPPADLDARDAEVRLAAAVAGPVFALALAGLLVSVRPAIGLTNVGLLMVLPVLPAATIGGRASGALTAAAAAFGLNLFHTEPYLSLSVAARRDLISVALLGIVGGIVGEAGHRSARNRRRANALTLEQRDVDQLLAAAADGAGVRELWPDLREFVCWHAAASRCAFQSVRAAPAELESREISTVERTFVVPVRTAGCEVGHLTLELGIAKIERPQAETAKRAASILGMLMLQEPLVPDTLT